MANWWESSPLKADTESKWWTSAPLVRTPDLPEDEPAPRFSETRGLGVPEPVAAEKPKMVIEPFDANKHKPRDLGLGGKSTEILITEDAPDGGYWNIPTVWWDQKGEPRVLSAEQAQQVASMYEQETGKRFPRFSTPNEGSEAAQSRSNDGGGQVSALAAQRQAQTDTTDDARAERGFARSAYMDDGMTPNLPTNTPVRDVARAVETPSQPDYQNRSALGVTVDAAKRGGLRTASSLPMGLATSDATALQDAARSDQDILWDTFKQFAGADAGRLRSLDVSTPEKAAQALVSTGAPAQNVNTFRQLYDQRLTRANDARQNRDVYIKRYLTNAEAGGSLLERAYSIPMSESAERMKERLAQDETLSGTLSALVSNPMDALAFLGEVGVESAPAIAASIGAGVVARNPVISGAVLGVGSAAQEFGASAYDVFQDAGMKIDSPEAAKAALDNPALWAAAGKRGATRATVIALFEMMGQGVAAKQLMQSKVGDAVVQTLAQMATGAGGEATAMYASGEELKGGEILIEGLAEGLTAPFEVGSAAIAGRREASNDRNGGGGKDYSNSPLLTENDRKSAVPDDVIGHGKELMDEMLNGKSSPANVPDGAVPMDTLYGKTVAPLDEAAPNVITPTQDVVQRPLPTDRLSPTLGAAPSADALPQRPDTPATQDAPQRPFEDVPEMDGDVDTGRTVRVYEDGQVEFIDPQANPATPQANPATPQANQEQNAQTQAIVPQTQEPVVVSDVPAATRPVTPPRETLQKRPLTNMLKAVGVKPGSPLAKELEARGINSRTAPGLFKATGHTDWDNLPANEWGDYARVIGDDGNGYMSRDGLIQAVEDEMRGVPVQVGNQIALQEAKDLREYAQEFGRDDDFEIDLSDVPEARSYIPSPDEDISTPSERGQWIRRDIDAALSETNMRDIITPAEYAELYDGLEANGGDAEDMLWGVIRRSADGAEQPNFEPRGRSQATAPAVREGLGEQVIDRSAEGGSQARNADVARADVGTAQAEGKVDGVQILARDAAAQVPPRDAAARSGSPDTGSPAARNGNVPNDGAGFETDTAQGLDGLAATQAADVPQVAPDVPTASKALADARVAFNKVRDGGPSQSLQPLMDATKAMSQARDGMADALSERGGRIELKSSDGLGAVITPRPDGKPGARITYFDGKGFSGDTSHDTLKAAVRDAIGQGYEAEAKGYLKNRQALWPKSKRTDVAETPAAQNTPSEGIKAAPEAANVQTPSFEDFRAVLPKDSEGYADVIGAGQAAINNAAGTKAKWADLTDNQKKAAFKSVGGDFSNVTAPEKSPTTQVAKVPEAQPTTPKPASVNTKSLRLAAQTAIKKANEAIDAPRQDNTARRARMADGAISDATARKRNAETAISIADAVDANPETRLSNVKSVADIQRLENTLRRAQYERLRKAGEAVSKAGPITEEDIDSVEAPSLLLRQGEVQELLDATKGARGVDRRALQSLQGRNRETYIRVRGNDVDVVDAALKAAKKKGALSYSLKTLNGEITDYKALERMIGEDQRGFFEEYLEARSGTTVKKDPVKEIRKSLIGVKIPGFFETPEALAEQMVNDAGVSKGDKVLEPNGGLGRIANAAAEIVGKENVDVIEINGTLRTSLEAQGFDVVASDFMQYDKGGYDAVIMNPPFENRQDAAHVMHAHELVKPGGNVVAIMGEGVFFGSDKKAVEFREWLDEQGGVAEKLPEGTFKESGTGVNTRYVVVPKAAATASKTTTEQTEAGTQTVVPGAEQSTERSDKARDADRKREADVRRQQSKMRTGVEQNAPGGLFDTDQGDMFDAPRQDAPAATPAPAQTGKIEDFGEKLEGAQKDKVKGWLDRAQEVSDDEIATVPLSKSWPEPDYQAMLDSGMDPEGVAFMHAARDEIPAKPRQTWKAERWAKQVQILRDFTAKMASGEIDMEDVRSRMAGALEMFQGRIDLYQEYGHDKSLKDFKFGVASYTVFKGERFDKARKIWTIQHKGNIVANGSDRATAIADFADHYAQLGNLNERPKGTKFEIRKWRNGNTFIGKKVGKDWIEVETRPDWDWKEARAYLAENQEALEAKFQKMKELPPERGEENAPRVGVDHRNGQDVTPEMFSETFGFRGVQFGNYVEGPRRQADLNNAYDGLMDLAGVVGVPPKAMSLNGTLGLAFGARGSGRKASAHYEPGKVVINLTKGSGAGSLAHEWWHGLDHYFAMQGGKKDILLTETGGRGLNENIRPEVVAEFQNLMTSVRQAELKVRSLQADKRKSKPYFSKMEEMTARSFESYVIGKLQDQSASNDYLANILSQDAWEALEAMAGQDKPSWPYVTVSEMPAFREAFDKLFDTIQTEETADGTVRMFQRQLDMFYSPLYRAVMDAKQTKAPAGDWKAIIAKLPGVKKVEIDWLGVEDWLDSQQGMQVTREDLAEFVRGSQVQIVEEVGGPDGSGPNIVVEEPMAVEPDSETIDEMAEDYMDDAREEVEAEWLEYYGEDSFDDMEPEDIDSRRIEREVKDRAREKATQQYAENPEFTVRVYDDNGIFDQTVGYDAQDGSYYVDGEYLDQSGIYSWAEDEAQAAGPSGDGPDFDSKFESYTEDGGTNYREVLLRVPDLHTQGRNNSHSGSAKAIFAKMDAIAPYDAQTGRRDTANLSDEQRVEYSRLRSQFSKQMELDRAEGRSNDKKPFVQSVHFEQENIVVHARVKDRVGPNGERVLFVEEIQSDLASKWRESQETPEIETRRASLREERASLVREKDAKIEQIATEAGGYDTLDVSNVIARVQVAYKQGIDPVDNMRGEQSDIFYSMVEANQLLMEEILDTDKRIGEIRNEELRLGTEKRLPEGTPDTPFQQEHTYNLMVKRLLRMAAEEGYDQLSWTPGYMQAERWNSAAQSVVEGVDWKPAPENQRENGATRLINLKMADRGGFVVWADRAGTIVDTSEQINSARGKPLSSLIGPNLAKQVLSEDSGSVSGQKITFPDSGYAIAYDQQTRKAVDKLVKKHGTQVRVDKSMPDFAEPNNLVTAARNLNMSEAEAFERLRQAGIQPDTTVEKQVEKSGSWGRESADDRDQAARLIMLRSASKENRILDVLPESASPVWSVTITPELREAAMQPMAMFRQSSAQDAATVEAAMPDLAKRLKQMMLGRVKLEMAEGADFQGAFEARGDDLRILVGATQDSMKTVNHEAVHALRNLNLFTDNEWEALTAQAKSEWLDKYDIATRYDDLSAEGQIEEAIAEAFADFVAEQTEPGPIKSAFAKMRRMMRAVKEWLTDNPSVQGVFEAVDSGRVGGRDATARGDSRSMQKAINTTTEAFKRWFGDSKVVDADGKPLVVYHGSNAEIEAFDPSRAQDGDGRRSALGYGRGKFYFSEDQSVARSYSLMRGADDPKVQSVYLKVEKPITGDEYEARYREISGGREIYSGYDGEYDSFDRDMFIAQLDDALKAEGYDGIINDLGQIAVFSPTQIKSVNNRGTFDPDDARILYQRQATARQKTQETLDQMPRDVSVPNRAVFEELFARNRSMLKNIGQAKGAVGDRMDVAREYMQDRILPLRRAQEEIERVTGQPIAEEMNAYVKEETYHGKVGRRLEDVRQFTFEPIADLIANSKELDSQKVNDYLTALHAEERNARIAKINPEMPDGGSGLTNAEAQEILNEAKLSPDYAALKEISRLVGKLRDDALQLRVDAGLMTAKDAAVLKGMYKNYVPLKGYEEFDGSEVLSDRPNVGRGYSVKGPETKQALGRKTRSFDVLANILTQAQEVAIRAEKNRIGKAVFDLASQYPSEKLWRVREIETKRVFNKQTGLVETRSQAPTARALADNEMAVKIDGKEYRIEFMDERLARAMGAVKIGQMGDLVRILSLPARYFSAVNTMVDPEFVVRNAFRDMQAAQINIRNFGEAERNAIAKGMIKNWPKALKAAYQGQKGKVDTEWTKWYREFEEAGAKVSFWKMEDAENMKADLDRQVYLKRGNKLVRAGKVMLSPKAFFSTQDNAVLGFIERSNLAVDNAVRLAAYVEARKAGWSKQKAASLSKNLTVNFNRRGHYGPVMNALYPFYNAGMQGTQVLFRAMQNPKRMSKYVVGMIGLGIINDLINAAISDEDDDGVLAYDKLQKHKQEMSLVISTGDGVVTIPMSYGYNVFPYMGTLIGQVMRGVKDPDEALVDFADAAVSAFSPIYESDAFRTLMPMVGDLPYDLVTNSDWLHRPIRPENPYGDYGPDAYKFYGGASEWAKGLADVANRATGGTIAEPGMIDISPEYIDHIWGFASGGAGRFVSNTSDMAAKIMTGKMDEIEGYRVPFVRQGFSETGHFLDRNRYYDFREKVKSAIDARETAKEAGEPLSKLSYDLSKLSVDVKLADKVMSAVRKERAAAGTEATAEQRKEWEARESKAILRFNKKYVDIAGESIE